MGSIRKANRQIVRCVRTNGGLAYDEADTPTNSPGQVVKLHEATFGVSGAVYSEVAAESDARRPEQKFPSASKDAGGHSDSQFWQEVFSSLSMLAPSLYAYLVCEAAAAQFGAFRLGVYALVYSTYFHCAISMYYHMNNALREGEPGFNAYLSPFRVADLAAIHVCCVTFGWAVSHGAALFTLASIVLNGRFIHRLVSMFAKGDPGSEGDGIRVAVSIFIYLSPMLARGDFENYLGALCSFLLAGACWVMAPRTNGWTHGFFHLMLTPYFHFLLRSAASVNGHGSFLY